MKKFFLFLLFLFICTFISATELRIEVLGAENTIWCDNVVEGETVLDIIEETNLPFELNYYPEYNSSYLRSLAEHTAQGISGWQYFDNWQLANVGVDQYLLEENSNILLIYSPDFTIVDSLTLIKIDSDSLDLIQGENLEIQISYLTNIGFINLDIDSLILKVNNQEEIITVNNNIISRPMNEPGIFEIYINQILNGEGDFIRSNRLLFTVQPLTSTEEEYQGIVTDISSFPNPFIGNNCWIQFSIKNKNTPLNIEIYNIRGQKVKNIFVGKKGPGIYKFSWNGQNNQGRFVRNGIYFFKTKKGRQMSVKKILLLK
ncbi:T9SS type A sorting domain-containing protein [bacterium]|nr:T9SS type A sorting domain-containing protein [bacterium]